MFYFQRTLGLTAGIGLVLVLGTPAYGIDFHQSYQVKVQQLEIDFTKSVIQSLVNDSYQSAPITRDTMTVMNHAEVILEVQSGNSELMPISGSNGLLNAAMARVGIREDCTALIENAFRALGYDVPDLGPMGFSQYGVVIDPSQVQPGDIMMRPGHAAIYAGNGMAVQGGFGSGYVAYTSIDASPYNYQIIIRV